MQMNDEVWKVACGGRDRIHGLFGVNSGRRKDTVALRVDCSLNP
jgi:hypothetical protein